MDNRNRAPRQWNLEPRETLNSYKNWKENLVYTLSLDPAFKPFLVPNATWGKLTTATPYRGLTDDGDTVPQNVRRTKEDKSSKRSNDLPAFLYTLDEFLLWQTK